MPSQVDFHPYFFDVYYRLEVAVGRENEYISQPHFSRMQDALAEHRRISAEGGPLDAIAFEVSDIRGPKVVHHYVGMTDSQRAITQLRLAEPEAGDPMDEPF